QEQLIALGFRYLEFIFLSIKGKAESSIHAIFNNAIKYIGLIRCFGFRISFVTRIDTKTVVDGEPFQRWKREAFLTVIIPNPDGKFACMFVEYHPNMVPCDKTGLGILTGL